MNLVTVFSTCFLFCSVLLGGGGLEIKHFALDLVKIAREQNCQVHLPPNKNNRMWAKQTWSKLDTLPPTYWVTFL